MELPIRLPGLGHVNCYAILDKDGAAVVDPGLPGPGTWRAIQARLSKAGLRVRDVHTVLVTHSHPDHFGGAARFAREADAKVVAHRAFSFGPPAPSASEHDPSEHEVSVDDLTAQNDGEEAETPETDEDRRTQQELARFTARRTPWGGERPRPPFWTRMRWMAMRLIGGRIVPVITHPVEHGDVLVLAGREWFVVHTPGHTGDHICLHDPEARVMLPRGRSRPAHHHAPHRRPDGLLARPVGLLLLLARPGGGDSPSVDARCCPPTGIPSPTFRAAPKPSSDTTWSVSMRFASISRDFGSPATVQALHPSSLFKPRSWGSMAESETYAHLEHLRIAGGAERHVEKDGTYLYLTS